MKSKILKATYIFLAFIFLGLGGLGVVVPILPTTPFLLLASYFFARGSERFHKWFVSTKVYQEYLEEFVETRAMTLKRKLCILLPVSTMLTITGILVNNAYARVGISIVFVFKYYYFFAHIATIKPYDTEFDGGVKINEDEKQQQA